ncbi:MAG: hypothetical protein QOE89_738, partial [Pseudonocardiales bacterium]|nr:hypothetical protein [Pseudonocardiales bacterium]
MSDPQAGKQLTRSPQQYVYDLSDAERNELTREFLGARAILVRDRFACFQIEGTDPFANIARQV